METKTIADILQSFREDLPDHSKTAVAIDRGASLADISNLAQAEGLHEIVTILFEAQQEALRENPEAATDPTVATQAFIQNFRTRLPNDSKTAAAIDRGAPWEEISECAEAEGVHKLAAALLNPEREHMHDSA
ncbi:MAG TPA: hypothetical protein P5260_07705 [Candidatus Competibacter sp.]|jgi:hypothetical protein|nr:hypothetical protein [Candidatus Competibacter sp.]MCC9002797.1 hypothetical protein [Candidatus Competibacter sp.]HRF62973.1 hypothetical protein [Candidatus Competibacter sp.]HRX61089.1 hypothetical protein [Candidatus Competibacter sp.]HUM89857.1 hypothetical protein [Candidatus Competibacter sp.]